MNPLHRQTSTDQRSWVPAVALVLALITGSAMANTPLAPTQVSIATQLREVQRGTFDGRDYLTLHIGGHEVGPSSCRGNVLRMDTGSVTGAVRQEEIERIALSAMLSKALLMIVVPMDASQCVDGRPTFTDLYLLPPSL